MYHDGNIQSGITLALRESKHVVCLVRGAFYYRDQSHMARLLTRYPVDDGEGSSTWEEQYLADEEVLS